MSHTHPTVLERSNLMGLYAKENNIKGEVLREQRYENISNYKLFFMIMLISGCLVSQLLYANTDNYKNILIGDRASTMAGAFSAISDDSLGSFIILLG